MLYVIHGTDTNKAREKVRSLTDTLLSKKPDSNLFNLNEENFSTGQISELIGGAGLFEQNYIVILDKLLKTAHQESVFDYLPNIGSSSNVFILIEETINKKELKKLEKHSAKIQEYSQKEKAKQQDYNIFKLTDILGSKNAPKLWTEYQKAVMSGKSAEEIHGILLWQVRSMIAAEKSSSPTEAGLKPFVYSKSKKYASNYRDDGLKELSHKLVEVFHEARRGKDFEVGLEQTILTI